MSAFYDLASLVLVPSGTKAQKIYAQKPLTTDGQLAFTRSTTATRVNSAGLIEASAINVPRLDYTNSTCPKLLLEPQRANSATYSEQFDNAAWLKTNATVTANDAISPDGYANADKVVFANGSSTIYQTYNFANATVTRSVYIKGTAGETISIDDIFASQPLITLTGAWQRISFTAAAPNGYGFGISTFGGATARTIWLWGAQVEAGAYATSYIPTLGAAVTRGADAAVKTGISSLIGQTEGTMFADFTLPTMANTGANLVSMSLFNAGLTNATVYDIYDGGDLFAAHVNGTAQASIQKTGLTAGRHKVAFGYKANNFVLYVDGALVGTDTSGTVGAQDSFGLQYGTSQFIGQQYVSQALLFTTRLTNAQLAELTTI